MLKHWLLSISIVFIVVQVSEAQEYSQAGVIHSNIQFYTKGGIQINGTSKEMHISYPSIDSKIVIRLDPKTITTDNIDFNEQLEKSDLETFIFTSEIDASALEFHSKYNESIKLDAETVINNITDQVEVVFLVSNKKTTNRNTIIIVGKAKISVADFELNETFPDLVGEILIQFTQNLIVTVK